MGTGPDHSREDPLSQGGRVGPCLRPVRVGVTSLKKKKKSCN